MYLLVLCQVEGLGQDLGDGSNFLSLCCPQRQTSRVERFKAKVVPLSIQVKMESSETVATSSRYRVVKFDVCTVRIEA